MDAFGCGRAAAFGNTFAGTADVVCISRLMGVIEAADCMEVARRTPGGDGPPFPPPLGTTWPGLRGAPRGVVAVELRVLDDADRSDVCQLVLSTSTSPPIARRFGIGFRVGVMDCVRTGSRSCGDKLCPPRGVDMCPRPVEG